MKEISADIFFTFYIIGIFVFSLVLYNLFSYFSHSFGIREFQKTEANRWNPQHKPSVGGFVFYLVFLFTMILSTLLFGISTNEKIKVIGLWGSATVAFFMGFADDTFNTQPIVKLVSQLLCASLLIITGTFIHLFENNFLNYFFTIFWVVGIMNSINMLDNMDGIAGSVSLYILSFVLIVMYNLNINLFSVFFLVICGIAISLIAFLFFNFYPSKIFMGDTGSQFLGLILSYTGIEYLWNIPIDLNNIHPVFYHFGLIALIYLILITDTSTVTINRLLSGGSPFVGGKDHITHYLCKRGLSERKVFYLFTLISFICLFIAYQWLFSFSMLWFYAGILLSSLLFVALYLNTKLFWPEKK